MDSFEGIIEFVAVVEAQGFSAAAKQLGCSASHVSRQVARLEKQLGCALLARSTRMVNLTDNGSVYYQQAKALVVGLQQANEDILQQQIQLSGTLKVSAAGGFAEHHVAPALMEFAAQHPELSIEIDFNSRYVNLLEDGVDFAIRYGQLSDSNLIARKLVSRPMMAVASQAYLAQCGTPKHPLHLKHHSCLVSNSNAWRFIENGAEKTVKVSGRWRSNNANVLLEACKHGLGIAYMPQSTFEAAIENQQVQPILEPYWGEGSSSWIVYQNKRFMPLRVRLVIDFLVQYFSEWQD